MVEEEVLISMNTKNNNYDYKSARDAHLRIDILEEDIISMSKNMKKSADNTTMIKYLIAGGLLVYTGEKFELIRLIVGLL